MVVLLGALITNSQCNAEDMAKVVLDGVVRAAAQGDKNAQQGLLDEANSGNAYAQFELGCCYDEGDGGFARNSEQAVKCFRQAAEQGLPEAQNRLGYCYSKGIGGLDRDPLQALDWYHKAAEQGLSKAQYNLGLFYENGNGIGGKDLFRAKVWYEIAARNGDPDAQRALKNLDVNSEPALASTQVQPASNELTIPNQLRARILSATTSTKEVASKFWERNGDGVKSTISAAGAAIGGFYKRNQAQIDKTAITIAGAWLGHQLLNDSPQPDPVPDSATIQNE